MTLKEAILELKDELTRGFVGLQMEIRFLRLEGRDREKRKLMQSRDDLSLKINILEEMLREQSY